MDRMRRGLLTAISDSKYSFQKHRTLYISLKVKGNQRFYLYILVQKDTNKKGIIMLKFSRLIYI